MRCQVQLIIYFGGISLLSMKDCVSFVFLVSWALVILYLWSRFCIFNRLVLEEYVSQVGGGGGDAHLL